MIIIIGVALIAIGTIAYAVSVGQQNRMDAGIANEAKKRPQYNLSNHRQISGLYTKMRAKFAKEEQSFKKLRTISIISISAGVLVIAIGLFKL